MYIIRNLIVELVYTTCVYSRKISPLFKSKISISSLHNYDAYPRERWQISLLREDAIYSKIYSRIPRARDDFTGNFRATLSFFAVSPRWFPFSPFYHFRRFLPFPDRMHRTAPANNHYSLDFPERTPLKVSTISRDNRRTANSLMHIAACVCSWSMYLLIYRVYTYMDSCVCVCVCIENKYERGRAVEEGKTEKEYPSVHRKYTAFFVHLAPFTSFLHPIL